MKDVLQPKCIPKVVGASWAGKVVEREYAFEDPDVPREKTQYLKVVYDAKYPAPEEEVCSRGGEFFQKILNSKAPVLETFILKRKLMGPCWIRISDPQPHKRGVVSWCPLEVQADSPKQISRLDLVVPPGTSPRPSPPVVTVTLKLKTIVNPTTQKSEVVSVTALCHKKVFLDSATDQSRGHMTQVSLIRPIHLDGNTQTQAQFPRDLDDEMFFVSGLTESGMKIDEKDQTEHHKKMFKLSDKLVKELKESDVIIISAPIYNYGPPATLKAWSDLAARIGETFRFKPNGRREGLLKNKHAYLVITSGGTKLNSAEDFLTPWLKFILNFFGIEKVDIISADQMALDYEKSISDAEAQIEKLFKD